MKYLLILLLVFSCTYSLFAQQITRMHEIDLLVAQIDGMELESKQQPLRNGNYTFMSDAAQGQLQKVIVKDSSYKKSSNYYYHNEQLIFINSPFGRYYFRDDDFRQVTSNWKDENDLGLLKREMQIATAYRFLIMHKKSKGTKSITQP